MVSMPHPCHPACRAPAPAPSYPHCAAGQVVRGLDVVDAINALSLGRKDNTATAAQGALIADSGQLRRGTLVPDLKLGLEAAAAAAAAA